jgi:hypothetical protein
MRCLQRVFPGILSRPHRNRLCFAKSMNVAKMGEACRYLVGTS